MRRVVLQLPHTVGDLDVEDFPTVLVAAGGSPRFFGPIMPQREVLARLVDAHRTRPGTPPLSDDRVRTLLARVLER